jgi:hypothetical protein
VSLNIKSPGAGTTVPGNPLHVEVHYNTTLLFIRRSPRGYNQGVVGASWEVRCVVEGIDGTLGYWEQTKTVPATGGAGSDVTFDFWDVDESPIPEGSYEVSAVLFQVFSFGGLSISIPFGSDAHWPVDVDNP